MKRFALFIAAVGLGAGSSLFAKDSTLPDYRIDSPIAVPQAADEPLMHSTIAPGFSLGIRGAYMGDPNADFSDGELFGALAIRIHVLEVLSIEGYGAWHREDDQGVQSDVIPVQISILGYLFPHSPVSVYLLGGVGWYFIEVEFDHPFGFLDFSDQAFGYHAGLGIDFLIHRNLSATIDGRYVWLHDTSDFLPEVSGDQAYQLMGGLNLEF